MIKRRDKIALPVASPKEVWISSDIIRGKKPRIKVSSAKAKGRECQKWVGAKIGELTGLPFGKDCPIESRPMGQSGVDVRLDAAVKERFPWSVECKATESWDVPGAIKQAKANQMRFTDWLVVMKKSREKHVVILDAEVFFQLLAKIPGERKGL